MADGRTRVAQRGSNFADGRVRNWHQNAIRRLVDRLIELGWTRSRTTPIKHQPQAQPDIQNDWDEV